MSRRAWIAPALAAACLALAGGIFACGTEDSGSPAATATPGAVTAAPALSAYLVTEQDLRSHPEDSPAHAFLLWWQAMQYDNMTDAYAGLTTRLRESRPRALFVRDARDAGGGFTARPKVTDTRETGSRRVMLFVNVQLIGENGIVTSFLPRTFRMAREAGEWRVDDLAFVDVKAAEGRAARVAADDDAG